MSKFSKGEWEFDTELCFVKNKKGNEIAELFWDKDDGDKEERLQANGRLIAAAPEMYGLLKTLSQRIEENEAEILGVIKMPFTKTRKGVSVDKDNSSYWEVKSFFNFSEAKALLARIDGEEEMRVISKRAFCKWLRNNREKIEKMLNEEEVKHD